MKKADLRRLSLARQRALASEEVTRFSQQICDRFFDFFTLEKGQVVHCFLPIAKNNEVNTRLLVERLQTEYPFIQVVVPKAHLSDCTLTHHWLTPATVLITNAWGIQEPITDECVSPACIDYVLVPLLAYDQQGYRVGYGKGFYDRFLAECRSDVVKVGVSYFEPVSEIADTHPLDIRLDYCLTPHQVWSFVEND